MSYDYTGGSRCSSLSSDRGRRVWSPAPTFNPFMPDAPGGHSTLRESRLKYVEIRRGSLGKNLAPLITSARSPSSDGSALSPRSVGSSVARSRASSLCSEPALDRVLLPSPGHSKRQVNTSRRTTKWITNWHVPKNNQPSAASTPPWLLWAAGSNSSVERSRASSTPRCSSSGERGRTRNVITGTDMPAYKDTFRRHMSMPNNISQSYEPVVSTPRSRRKSSIGSISPRGVSPGNWLASGMQGMEPAFRTATTRTRRSQSKPNIKPSDDRPCKRATAPARPNYIPVGFPPFGVQQKQSRPEQQRTFWQQKLGHVRGKRSSCTPATPKPTRRRSLRPRN